MAHQLLRHASQRLSAWAPRSEATLWRFMTTESHDDFKPQAKAQPEGAMKAIEEDVKKHDVLLFMKGWPAQPMCGFSARVVALLNGYDVKFEARNVLDDNEVREGIKKFSNWPTIPQLYVKGEFVGGCDVLWEAHEAGEFEALVGKK